MHFIPLFGQMKFTMHHLVSEHNDPIPW